MFNRRILRRIYHYACGKTYMYNSNYQQDIPWYTERVIINPNYTIRLPKIPQTVKTVKIYVTNINDSGFYLRELNKKCPKNLQQLIYHGGIERDDGIITKLPPIKKITLLKPSGTLMEAISEGTEKIVITNYENFLICDYMFKYFPKSLKSIIICNGNFTNQHLSTLHKNFEKLDIKFVVRNYIE